MNFLDIHTHLSKTKALANCDFSVVNMDISEIEMLFKTSNSFDFLNKYKYLSIGIHPNNLSYINNQTISRFAKLCSKGNVDIIGEIGLDKKVKTNYELQKQIFYKTLDIANNLSKPVVLHIVGAIQDVINLRNVYKNIPMWIIHGFRGKPEQASQYIKKGFYLSFGEKYNVESVKVVPLDKIFIETDVSEIDISEIYKDVAKIKCISIETLLEAIKKHIP